MSDYQAFLESKIIIAERNGFDVYSKSDLLFPHQQVSVEWAANLGRALIASDFGLGKTRVQCELARQVTEQTGKKFLIVCPLGVKIQFQEEDGPALGQTWKYVRTDNEARESETPYLITNYERVREGNLTGEFLRELGGVSLDEGSILRSLGSKTSQVFKEVFAPVPYRYVATATPSPNEYKELIYYSEFLGIMDHGQALTRWFKRDTSHAGHLTLHEAHEKDFWMWVASWALFLHTPSDLGFDDAGYVLPKLNVHYHRVQTDQSRAWKQMDNRGQHRLFLDSSSGVSEASQEKRATLSTRLEKMLEILRKKDNKGKHWLLWHTLEDERRAIEKSVPLSQSIYGSEDLDEREARVLAFMRGELPILAAKPRIAGSGCNFQRHCYSNIFLGVDYKFQDFIQAIHRTYRFQQPHDVDVHIIYAESEDSVIETLQKKWEQHNELTMKMRALIKEYGLNHVAMKQTLQRTIGVERMETQGQVFTAINNDCVDETKRMVENSIDLIHTSIPFGNHYEYTTKVNDFGHNASDGEFWEQMKFLIPSLLRVLKPGRIAAIHVKDRILYGHQTPSGFMEVAPFSDQCVSAFKAGGFLYEGRRTIVTDVVRENASTYRLGWTEMTKDATKMGSGLPEYLLTFRKPPSSSDTARADEPVTHDKKEYTRARWQVDAHNLWRSNGNRFMTPEELADLAPDVVNRYFAGEQLNAPYNHERHVAICEALDTARHLSASYMTVPPKVTQDESQMVWDDIVMMETLNSNQSRGRSLNHICPLPFDTVERVIRLYSNEGDLVLDPFAGLFTVPYLAIKMKRRAIGIELNKTYFDAGVRYCQDIEQAVLTPSLFTYLESLAVKQDT